MRRIAIVLLLAVSCTPRGGVESAMIDRLQTCASPCVVTLKSATPFDWDRAIAFKYTAGEKERDDVLGTRYHAQCELERQLVFLRHGQIVHDECGPTNVEHPVKNEVIFDIPEDANFKSYGPNARFTVRVENGTEGPYYLLNEISSPPASAPRPSTPRGTPPSSASRPSSAP